MKNTFRMAGQALIALVLGVSASATTITFDSNGFPIDGGGQFGAHLDSNSANSLTIYCVDFNNSVQVGSTYNVTISTPTSLANITGTHFGNTPQGSFLVATAGGNTLGDALARYLEAAWLITQYDLSPGANTGNKDVGIQNAIWNILNVGGPLQTDGDEQTWMDAAALWLKGQNSASLAAFGANIRIYTPSGSYGRQKQEMIGFVNSVPEPASVAMAAIGMALIGLGSIRQRRKANARS